MTSNLPLQRQTCQILIIDDHQMVRKGIRFMLESKNDQFQFRIVEAEDASDAMRKLAGHGFDIILLDYQLPGLQGPELTEKILQIQPDARIICMSSYTELMNVRKMTQAGAAGYIAKSIDALELIAAIKSLMNGQAYYSAAIANILLTDNRRAPQHYNEAPRRLSSRELEILKLIALEKTTREIASQLYLGERTVETHRKNIIQKLGVKNTAGLIRVAHELKILP